MKIIKKAVLLILVAAACMTSFVGCSMKKDNADVHVFYYTYSDTYISTVRSALDRALTARG